MSRPRAGRDYPPGPGNGVWWLMVVVLLLVLYFCGEQIIPTR